MSAMDSPKTILRTLTAAKRILIPLHLHPDGDVVGSALAAYHFLKDLGKEAVVVSADPVPDSYFFLPAAKRIRHLDPSTLNLSKFDLLLFVDNGAPSRGSTMDHLELPSQLIVINIDHHKSNRNYGDLNYVVPNASATAEVLYDLLRTWKAMITPEIAGCLLTGIYTDTGSFLLPSASASSLAKAADLIKRGADRTEIAEKAFRSWPPQALQVWELILNHAKIKGGVSYSWLSFGGKRPTNHTKSELSGVRSSAVNNLLLAIDGVKVALLFTEERPKKIRVTLRSRGGFDVGKIADKMGGGGHLNSAAFRTQGPLKEVIAETLRRVGMP